MRKRRRWLGLLPQPGWASLISACYICKLSYSVGSNSWKEIIKFISNVQTWVWASHIFPLQIHNQCFIFMECILLSILKILVVSDHLGSDVPKGWIWLFQTLGPKDFGTKGPYWLWNPATLDHWTKAISDHCTIGLSDLRLWDHGNLGLI